MFDFHAMLKICIPTASFNKHYHCRILDSLYKQSGQTDGLTQIRPWNTTGPTIVVPCKNKAVWHFIGQPNLIYGNLLLSYLKPLKFTPKLRHTLKCTKFNGNTVLKRNCSSDNNEINCQYFVIWNYSIHSWKYLCSVFDFTLNKSDLHFYVLKWIWNPSCTTKYFINVNIALLFCITCL